MQIENESSFFFIGHRGTRVIYDENTQEAFQKALDYGANYLELDVRLTRDKNLVVFHDETMDRITSISKSIRDLNTSEIKAVRTKLTNSEIHLLVDVLDLFYGKTNFIIDFKQENIVNLALEIVKNKNLINSCVLSGRYLNELIEVKLKYSSLYISYNITKGKDLTLNQFLNNKNLNDLPLKPDMINLKSDLISRKFIDSCHEQDIKAIAWDFLNYQDPIMKMKELIKMGIDGIYFDNFKNILKIKTWIKKRNG